MISKNFKEFAIVGLVLTGLLLPVRLIFVEFVSDSTLGSFGVITLISIVLIVLAKKKKLGRFGEMFERQMMRITTGKKRILALSFISISLVAFGFMLYAIEIGNNVYAEEKEQIKEIVLEHYKVEFDSLDDVGEYGQVLEPEKVVGGMPMFFDSIFTNFKAIAITEAIVNDMSNGMIQHFAIVFFVEQVEILGIFIYYSVTLRKKEIVK